MCTRASALLSFFLYPAGPPLKLEDSIIVDNPALISKWEFSVFHTIFFREILEMYPPRTSLMALGTKLSEWVID